MLEEGRAAPRFEAAFKAAIGKEKNEDGTPRFLWGRDFFRRQGAGLVGLHVTPPMAGSRARAPAQLKLSALHTSAVLQLKCAWREETKVVLGSNSVTYSVKRTVRRSVGNGKCVEQRAPRSKRDGASVLVNTIKEWVKYYSKRNDFDLPDSIINKLIDSYGDNINNVINEVDKLYLHSSGKIDDVDSIIKSNIYKKESQVWKLLDSIGKKNISDSITIYTQLYNNNVPMIRVLLNLLDLFKELINQKLKVKEGKFVRNKIILKNLNTYGRNFSAEQILNAIVLLRDCYIKIKTTSINEKYFFYSILVEICEGSGV